MSLPGKILYHLWHRPAGYARDLIADGGPWERRRTEAGRLEMIAAAQALPALPPAPADAGPVVVHLMTGEKYWHQTAFCLWSLARQSGRPVQPVILDDGSLPPAARDLLRRLFPAGRVVALPEVEARLDDSLPASRFPTLRARRREFPLLRKLTDVHAGLAGWRLFLDSDMLFFRRPDFLLGWLDRPGHPLRGEDVQNAYGYPLDRLHALAGRPVPERVNTGTLGLRSDRLDWDRLEHWCRELQRLGPHYYQEQALAALLLAGTDCDAAPAGDYVVLPLPPEALACRAVMHHYVAHSKRWYYQHNWRRILSA